MKTISLLTWFAVTAAAVSALGLMFDVLPFALFSVTLGAFLSLLLVHDYAPRPRRWEPAAAAAGEALPAVGSTAVQPLRLAA